MITQLIKTNILLLEIIIQNILWIIKSKSHEAIIFQFLDFLNVL